MRNYFILFVLFFSVANLHAQQILKKVSDYGRWSVAVASGFNYYDGDLSPSAEQILDGIIKSPNFDISFEYNINPTFSLGWKFGGLLLNQIDSNEDFTTGGIHSTPFVSADILNLIRGKKSSFMGVYLTSGIGFTGLFFPEYNRAGGTQPSPVTDGVIIPPLFLTIPITLSFEFNTTKYSSLGLVLTHQLSNTDHVDATHRGGFNDAWKNVSLSYRYKLMTKDKQHFRDASFVIQDPSVNLISQLQSDLNNLSIRMDTFDDKLDNLGERFVKLEGILSNDGPDADQDGVPDVRDLEPNTPPGTPVDFWGRSLGVKAVLVDDLLSVYFDFDSYQLDKLAQITIVKVANKMKSDPTLMLEIRGYTDNLGSGIYNQKLSQRRAERVKSELIKLHGIAHDRMVANGKGKIPNPPTKTLINRRCDFFFSK